MTTLERDQRGAPLQPADVRDAGAPRRASRGGTGTGTASDWSPARSRVSYGSAGAIQPVVRARGAVRDAAGRGKRLGAGDRGDRPVDGLVDLVAVAGEVGVDRGDAGSRWARGGARAAPRARTRRKTSKSACSGKATRTIPSADAASMTVAERRRMRGAGDRAQRRVVDLALGRERRHAVLEAALVVAARAADPLGDDRDALDACTPAARATPRAAGRGRRRTAAGRAGSGSGRGPRCSSRSGPARRRRTRPGGRAR